MARTVELVVEGTFDAADVVSGFGDVGDAARGMADDVDRAGHDAADGMGSFADSADNAGSAASTAAGGLGDLGGALSAMPGPLGALGAGMETAGPLIQGVTGATDLLTLAMNSNLVMTIRNTAATAANTVKTVAASAASKAWAATQWLLNAALSANPIGLVVIAVAALVGGIILAYQKSETFRNIVDTAMDAVHKAFDKVVEIVKSVPGLIQDLIDKAGFMAPIFETAKNLIVGYFELILTPINLVIDAVQSLIDWIGKIDFPDIPDIPGFGRTAAGSGGGFGVGGFSPAALHAGAADPRAVTVNVTGYVGDEARLAREIRRVLDADTRRTLGPA
jgi:phage-related protein